MFSTVQLPGNRTEKTNTANARVFVKDFSTRIKLALKYSLRPRDAILILSVHIKQPLISKATVGPASIPINVTSAYFELEKFNEFFDVYMEN